jgi:hypothetical protein
MSEATLLYPRHAADAEQIRAIYFDLLRLAGDVDELAKQALEVDCGARGGVDPGLRARVVAGIDGVRGALGEVRGRVGAAEDGE